MAEQTTISTASRPTKRAVLPSRKKYSTAEKSTRKASWEKKMRNCTSRGVLQRESLGRNR